MRAPNEWVCMTAISSKPDTIDWSPDGNSIVTGHVNHEIRLRDIRNFDTTRILFTVWGLTDKNLCCLSHVINF